MTPSHITALAQALCCEPVQGNRHWRVRCPICQVEQTPPLRPLLALWQGRSEGWRTGCLSGDSRCSPSALKRVIHSLLNTGAVLPAPKGEDTITEGMKRAQAQFRAGWPIEKDDPCDLFLRRYSARFEPEYLTYLRRGPGSRPDEFTLIEGLVDPISAFDSFLTPPPILGVTITYIRADGSPIIVCSPDVPKMKHAGRRQGMACPLGPVDRWDGNTIAVSVRAAHTLAHMQTVGLAYGLAVPQATALPVAYLPVGERFQYETRIADNGLALALAEALKNTMEELGSGVYIEGSKNRALV